MTAQTFKLSEGKRVLFLTKDPTLIEKQLSGELNLSLSDVKAEDLMDDINTDAMTPAWVCFDYDPELIAKNAYAGLTIEGKRLIPTEAIKNGNFEVIVSGMQKGVGSSRETAAQCEVFSGSKLAVASSFAPIHARNNINIGQLMTGYETLERLMNGEEVSFDEFTQGHDSITAKVIESGGLFKFCAKLEKEEISLSKPDTAKRPMNMAEKLIATHLVEGQGEYVKPGDAVMVNIDGGYSHEFTSAQVHHFLKNEYGEDYKVKNPDKFAVFEDHLIYADGVKKMVPFGDKIETLRVMQREFQKHTGVRNYSAENGVSPGICHQVAREQFIEPGDFIQATDSHTCMGGASGALSWGVGATEYAALIYWGMTPLKVPETIRFELTGALRKGVTAKDLILHILATFAKKEDTLDRIMEWGGEGLFSLSPDERATLANMATECTAKGAIMEVDKDMLSWIARRRNGVSIEDLQKRVVTPDEGAEYAGGVHSIDLGTIEPMVATPGDLAKGIASDPKNGAAISDLGQVAIDIAYGGSCTAGKNDDLDFYAEVLADAEKSGKKVKEGVRFVIQYGSKEVAEYAESKGYVDLFKRMGVEVISPGCGACIGCGPGVSENPDQVTVSAINRNYKGRSGPGNLYLASPLTVAASSIMGFVSSYKPGMFVSKENVSVRKKKVNTNVTKELERLKELVIKYPEIGAPLAELSFKLGHKDIGDSVSKLGAEHTQGAGMEFYFVAAQAARRDKRWDDLFDAIPNAISKYCETPDSDLDPNDGDRLLHLVRQGYAAVLFDLGDARANMPFIESLKRELPKCEERLGKNAFYRSLLAQAYWYDEADKSSEQWAKALELGDLEMTYNARGTWAKDAEKDIAKAEDFYSAGLEVVPDSALLMHNIAQCKIDLAEARKNDAPFVQKQLRAADELLANALRNSQPKNRRHIHQTRDRLYALRKSMPHPGKSGQRRKPQGNKNHAGRRQTIENPNQPKIQNKGKRPQKPRNGGPPPKRKQQGGGSFAQSGTFNLGDMLMQKLTEKQNKKS